MHQAVSQWSVGVTSEPNTIPQVQVNKATAFLTALLYHSIWQMWECPLAFQMNFLSIVVSFYPSFGTSPMVLVFSIQIDLLGIINENRACHRHLPIWLPGELTRLKGALKKRTTRLLKNMLCLFFTFFEKQHTQSFIQTHSPSFSLPPSSLLHSFPYLSL